MSFVLSAYIATHSRPQHGSQYVRPPPGEAQCQYTSSNDQVGKEEKAQAEPKG